MRFTYALAERGRLRAFSLLISSTMVDLSAVMYDDFLGERIETAS